jgi:hypothetical protein
MLSFHFMITSMRRMPWTNTGATNWKEENFVWIGMARDEEEEREDKEKEKMREYKGKGREY